jgi:hypothetical protein
MLQRAFPVVALLVPILAVPALAQKIPVGPKLQVNTFTAGDQGYQYSGCGYSDGRGQAAAGDPAGNFVVVWQSRAQDGDGWGIFGQRYDSAGTPLGAEFQVNSTTTADQRYPRVAMDVAGNFVVVWSGEDSYGSNANVRARRFDSAGTPQGLEFEVAAADTAYPRTPAVSTTGSGGFVVVWDAVVSGSDRAVLGRRYDSAGTPLGGAMQVSQALSYFTEGPDVAAHADGSFVVVWHEDYYVGGIMGRRFGSSGAPLADEFQIQAKDFFERFPRVGSRDAGGFVVAWRSSSIDSYEYSTDVALKRYDSTGGQVGNRIRVNTETAGSQRCSAVATAPDGTFVVTWHDANTAFAQQFTQEGEAMCGQQTLDPAANAIGTTVAMDANRNFVVAWMNSTGVDGSENGVFAQRFGDPPAPACSPTPKTGCRQPTVDGTGVFRFNAPANPARRTLLWKWIRGEATSAGDLGDPAHCIGYAVCVYDASGNPQPLISAVAPPGELCEGRACWRPLPKQGVEYFNRPTNADGLRRLRLSPGDDGRARVGAQATGANLALPATPLTPPVIVQAQGANGECWSGTYDAFIAQNANGRFRAKHGSPSSAFLDAE